MAVVHQTTSLTPTHRQTTFEGLKVGAGYQHVKHIWVCFASRYCNASIASPDIIHTHTHITARTCSWQVACWYNIMRNTRHVMCGDA